MLKDAEGNCWHDKSRKLYPCDQDHVVHRLQAAYREPTKRFTWIQHARPNSATCNVPISGITASTCDSTNCTMSPSITTGVTGSIRTTCTGSSESRPWQCYTASGAEIL